MTLIEERAFHPAGEIDATVPDDFGIYAIRLRVGSTLPEPFESLLALRSTRLIYIGQAERQTLLKRLLGNELRARGNGTFIRSIGAVLGYRPPFGSLAGRARVQNYRFSPAERIAVVEWINVSLEVSWAVLPQAEVHSAEVELIREYTPLLNLQDNPRALPELSVLRAECRAIAAGLSTPAL
ncbi:GIY-YIG nuclease family protein [Rathayibacter sp. YIM 133350]|uniref:GIY-YIG nuclease family protein n=1 Tax=Rathayibacter sp. YIM 133350 TaxID=3131992 RepID=UPI00307E636E